jgi:hypothetical protein
MQYFIYERTDVKDKVTYQLYFRKNPSLKKLDLVKESQDLEIIHKMLKKLVKKKKKVYTYEELERGEV